MFVIFVERSDARQEAVIRFVVLQKSVARVIDENLLATPGEDYLPYRSVKVRIKLFNTRTGKGLRITRRGKGGGGRFCPIRISASIRARITKLGKREDMPVNFIVCNFDDLGSIFLRSNGVKLKNMDIFGEMTDLHLLRSSAIHIIARIKPKQTCDSS